MRRIKLLYGLEAAGGGALKHLVYLVTRLNGDDFDITVILSGSRKENISEEIGKMENAGVRVLLFTMCRNINPIKDLYSLLKLTFFFKHGKFDIVHAHSSKAGALFRLAAWLCGVSFIFYTPHCFYFQGKKGLPQEIFILLERLLSTITTKVIVSEGEQIECIKYKIAKPSKTININNAIDFNEYRQSKEINETKVSLGIPVNAFDI